MISKIKEIFKWRELVFALAIKDLKIKYSRAGGGFGWMLIMPLVQAGIFTFIFKFLFKVKIDNYPLFLLSGLFPWVFLRNSLVDATNSIITNANLIKKTYFPRETLPISIIIINIVNFLFSLIALLIFCLIFRISLFPALFFLPSVIFIQIALIVGISLFFVSLNTVYREAQFILDILLLVWFYSTPIVYSLEMAQNALPKSLFFLYKLNPMSGIICAYQSMFVYGEIPDIKLLTISTLAAIVFVILGFISFRHYEEIFVDMV